jgi:hypothetical protein
MIIFWTNFGGGGAQGGMQFLPLLIFLVPMILNLIVSYPSSNLFEE